MIHHRYSKIIFAVIFLGVLIFFKNSAPVKYLKNSAVGLLKPVMNIAHRFQNSGISQELARFRQENERLKQEVFLLEKLRAENEELKSALNFQKEKKLPLLGARVLLYARELGGEFLLIDQGSMAGAEIGAEVVNESGFLVGVISKAEGEYSRVGIASNRGQTYAVTIAPSAVNAVAKGIGNRTFSLELIPADAEVQKGNLAGAVSSIGARKAASSLLLGEVVSEKANPGAAFKEVRMVLLARPENLEQVFVISAK